MDKYPVIFLTLKGIDAQSYDTALRQAARLIRRAALKTNSSLEFAVLTGCLRISKESIFTGLNNLSVYSVTDES